MRKALEAGAVGLISKYLDQRQFCHAVNTVAQGSMFIGQDVLTYHNLTGTSRRTLLAALSQSITRRESEILALVAHGLTTRDIAAQLSVSMRTVDRHRSNLMEKLGLHDKVQLTRHAIREGLTQL